MGRRVARLAAFAAAAALAALAEDARAQTMGNFGCRAAVSCSGPRGFSTTMGTALGHYPVFTVGMTYNRVGGFRARWNAPAFGMPDHAAIESAVDVVLARNPGLARQSKKIETGPARPRQAAPAPRATEEPPPGS